MRELHPSRPRLRALLVICLLVANCAACSAYHPKHPAEVPFRDRAQTQDAGDLRVTVAVLDAKEAQEVFGVPLHRRGIQPIWIQIENRSDDPYLLSKGSIDAQYFSALEAAYVSHVRPTSWLPELGAAKVLFAPLLVPGAIEGLRASRVNREMDEHFLEHGFGSEVIGGGDTVSGFVFAGLDEGSRKVKVVLYGTAGKRVFPFVVPVPHLERDLDPEGIERLHAGSEVEVDEDGLRTALEAMSCCTTDREGTTYGDPVNLVIVGELDDLLSTFVHAGWYETERLGAGSALRTVHSFLLGSTYRVSPVSDLYLFGRRQDIAFQKVRRTVNDRHHFRLWRAWLRFEGKPVWVGQASRDVGVRFTTKAWNLTTHEIDPDVDDARDYVIGDLVQNEAVSLVAYVEGVGEVPKETPRENLTGDPYFTDGYRAIAVLADPPSEVRVLDLE